MEITPEDLERLRNAKPSWMEGNGLRGDNKPVALEPLPVRSVRNFNRAEVRDDSIDPDQTSSDPTRRDPTLIEPMEILPIPEQPKAVTPPTVCCLYPWLLEDIVPPYSYDDLPDTVVFGGVTLSKVGTGWPAYGELIYGDDSDPTANYYILAGGDFFGDILGGFILHFGGDSPSTVSVANCLIDGTNVEDEFEDTYTVQFPGEDPFTITRVSLCRWTGTRVHEPDHDTTEFTLDYSDIAWTALSEVLNTKVSPQSSPVGDYTPDGLPGTALFTVA